MWNGGQRKIGNCFCDAFVGIRVPLVLICIIVACDASQTCIGARYLFPAPKTPEEFVDKVIASKEVFAVRFHDENSQLSIQTCSSWEKFAIVFKDKIRLVMYQMDDPRSVRMKEFLGIDKFGGIPHLRIYYFRNRTTKATSDGTTEVVDDCSHGGDDDEEVFVQEGGPELQPQIAPLSTRRRHRCGDADDRGTQHRSNNPPLRTAEVTPVFDEAQKIGFVVVWRAIALPFSRTKVLTLEALRGLETNSEGFFMKAGYSTP